MMEFNLLLYAAFVAAATALILVPGPNVLLIVSTSLSEGIRRGLQTVAGTTLAMAVQVAMVLMGFHVALQTAGWLFELFRWLGVAYLAYLGICTWTRSFRRGAAPARTAGGHRAFWRGAFVSIANPKTMAFFAAFLPQFVDVSLPVASQLFLLAATFVILAAICDSGYAVLAGKVSELVVGNPHLRRIDRVAGTLYLAAGAGLALIRQK